MGVSDMRQGPLKSGTQDGAYGMQDTACDSSLTAPCPDDAAGPIGAGSLATASLPTHRACSEERIRNAGFAEPALLVLVEAPCDRRFSERAVNHSRSTTEADGAEAQRLG